MKDDNYFKNRNVHLQINTKLDIPRFLLRYLPQKKNARILDIWCGQWQMLYNLKQHWYNNLFWIDASQEAVLHCKKEGFNVQKIWIEEIWENEKFDFIIMNHVLEHIDKSQIIGICKKLFHLLNIGWSLYITVPNAQSNTWAYWMYEDFTHETLFTSGSLYYVLRSGWFDTIEFQDIDNFDSNPYFIESVVFKKIISFFRRIFLPIYKFNYKFWNVVTWSIFHFTSPWIFGFEIKVIASKK